MQPLHRESLPLRQQRQWRHRALLLRLPQLLRRERPLRQARKLRLERPRLVEGAELRHQRRNRPASAKLIIMVKVAPRPLQVRLARRKRVNAPLANITKLLAKKGPAKVAARRRAKGVNLNRNQLKKRPPPNQALLRNVRVFS